MGRQSSESSATVTTCRWSAWLWNQSSAT